MSRFLTSLRIRRLEDNSHDGRGTWKLLSPLKYQSDVLDRVVIVPRGFVTDLASTPRMPLAYLLAGGIAHAAAVVHDFSYSGGIADITREQADKLLQEAAVQCGASSFQAWVLYMGVRIGGASHWDDLPKPQEPEVAAQMEVPPPIVASDLIAP